MITVSSVANATKSELVCIGYEICLDNIQRALDAPIEEKKNKVNQALESIKILSQALNFEVPLATNIFKIYVYVQGLLIKEWKDDHKLQEAYDLMHILYEGYVAVARQDTSTVTSMKNTESIYAGMTYGKNELNEVILQDKDRGFKA